jgi:hypothetical protein
VPARKATPTPKSKVSAHSINKEAHRNGAPLSF